MNYRMVSSTLAAAVAAALGASCARQNSTPVAAEAPAPAPGVRHEAHVDAGGVAPPALPPLHRPPAKATDAKSGEGLFYSMNCDGCHGGGAAGDVGPSLVDGRWRYGGADEEVFQSIFYGRPKGMPAFGGVLGSEGVWMIVAYLKAQPVPDVVPTTNYDELAQPAAAAPAVAPPAPAALSGSARPTDPSARLAQDGCTACHAIDHKVVGPALRDVAAKYHGQAGAAQRLEAKVKNGGAGAWGDIPMPPNAVPDAEIHDIVDWILNSPDVRR